MNDIENARHAIEIEIDGLKQMEEWLDNSFCRAVDLIFNAQGHVVIGGIGKSGHIANKIAATLTSTGTPSIFIHPTEASHGDLGMITKESVVILLSNSGETPELKNIINYTKRFSIPLIGIVRNKNSILAESADVALILPGAKEACIINAPTTSTTMMLVLGDALAVALIKRRNFNQDDFSIYHPGGKLGASFVKVKNLMHTKTQLPIIHKDLIMPEVVKEITLKSFGCTAVTDDNGNMVGIITDGDIRRHIDANFIQKRAFEIMTKNPVTISEEQLASEVLALMQKKAITNLFIVRDGKPSGIIHIHDLLRAGVL